MIAPRHIALCTLVLANACGQNDDNKCRVVRANAADVLDVQFFTFPTDSGVFCVPRHVTSEEQNSEQPAVGFLVVVADEASLADEFNCFDENDEPTAPPPSGVDFSVSRIVIEYQTNDFTAAPPDDVIVDGNDNIVLLHEVDQSCGSGAVPPNNLIAHTLLIPAGPANVVSQSCVTGPDVNCGFGSQPP